MAYQLSDINAAVRSDPKAFLETCDGEYRARVSAAADAILERMDTSPIVLLAGPSGSGKTTTAMKLEEELEKRGVGTHTISLDNYFLTLDPDTAPRGPNGEIDFESPALLDMPLLDDTFTRLSRGEEVLIPRFDFPSQTRDPNPGRPLRLGNREVAIFEGIHALGPGIAGPHPEATRLYISPRSNVMDGDELLFKGSWMRLTRRCVRDYNFRGTDVPSTLRMWVNVRRGETLYISPYRDSAHISIDSALPYELPVMKRYALPILRAVAEEEARDTDLPRLMEALERFEGMDPDLVAKDSLLREFIGGGSYQY